jgi:hypothetical protein
MPALGRMMRAGVQCLLLLALVLGIAGCSVVNISGNVEPWPTVASLPLPPLPDWIEQISPTGQVEPLAQIRIRFQEALIPVESLENPDRQSLLQKFEIVPPLPGQFRFLTPRMVGFQADQALPKATRIQVTLKAGLADLKQHRLTQDLSWTFNTEPIALTNLPGKVPDAEIEVEAIDLNPTLKVTSNVELDLGSAKLHVKLLPAGEQQPIPLKIEPEKTTKADASQQPQEQFDPSTQNWIYRLVPQRQLQKGTRYHLTFEPGLRPVRGNLPSATAFDSHLQTYGPLSFASIQFFGQPDAAGTYGRFVKGRAELRFNNGLVAESAQKQITVSPAPKPEPRLVQAYDGDRSVILNPWALEPATTYTITIGADLKDKFGQTLGKPVTLQYETGDVAADLWAPTGLNIFPSGQDLQLHVSAVNLPNSTYKAAYQVVQPADLVYSDSAYPQNQGNDWLSPPATWQRYQIPKPKPNQPTDITVPLREQLGGVTGMLAYGVQSRTNAYQQDGKQEWREPIFYGLVQLTNLGVFAQWFPDLGLIRVHHLADGSAVANATIEIYESKLEAKSRTPAVPCAIAKTDRTGTVLLKRPDFQACIPADNLDLANPPQLLVIAREQQDWAFTRIQEYSGAYGYGMDAGWNSGKPESRGTIFSDRQLYQPAETGWFTGVAAYLQNGTLQPDKNTRYTIKLVDPNGKITDLGSQTTNEFGTFSLKVPFAADQPLGYYTIRAQRSDDTEISGEFRVAEFKPPNFKVELALNQEFALMDQAVEAKAQSNYLFGPAVEGGKAQYYVTRQQTQFTPKGWQQFSFGRRWFWPEESPAVPSDVLQIDQVLSAQGQSSQVVKVAQDLPYPMTYRVDVQVSDVSNLSVADSQTFTALPSDRLIGVQSDFVAEANQAFPVQVIVTDPTGRAIADQRVRVELQQIRYSTVTQVVEGSRTPHNQVEYKTVVSTETRSGTTPVTVSLTPPESGSYRIRANFANARNELTATDSQIWATGTNPVDWGRRYRNNRLEVTLDKESYQPGETATALIQSPYPEGELYFAVVHHGILYQTTQTVKGGAPKMQFQVTPDMLPNAAVEAVLVRQGKPLREMEPGSLKKLVSIGFAPFKTSVDSKYLNVQVIPTAGVPNSAMLQPGEQQTVQLQLQDAQGTPVQGQLTVMAVNEAVLQLSGYRVPDLVETVYAEQPISTRFADNRPDVVIEPLTSPLEKGWGYGGGDSKGAASTRIRTNFQPLAYYNGSVLTDANGKAQVKFPLPDDLTTWRVMAVASDRSLRFGKGESMFMTSKPLVTNPVLPQFARPGDRFEVGVSVTNNTGQGGTLQIKGNLTAKPTPHKTQSPVPLAFTPENRSSPTVGLQTPLETGTRAYRFPIIAVAQGESTIQFSSQVGSTTDAFAVPLAVKPLTITEQVVETGVTSNSVKIPLKVDQNVVPDTGGLEIALASTLIPEITVPAKQVLEEESLPFLEPAASRLTIAANLQLLGQKYGQSFQAFNPSTEATQALAQLQKLQRSDGGFAAWPSQERSDPWVTPYAAQAIASAAQAFAGVPELTALQNNSDLSRRLQSYLQTLLANPGQYGFCREQWCKNQVRLETLLALANWGEPRNEFVADLYAQREQFDRVRQLKLARYLSLLPDWQQEAAVLAEQFQQTFYETGRTATVNAVPGWEWISSSTAEQAQGLRLFLERQTKPEVLDRLLQGLLALRRQGVWGNSYDTAEALSALVAYSQRQDTPANFAATAQLAGKKVAAAQFQGYRNPILTVQVPMTDLPRGPHDLLLQKSEQGKLHYLVAYQYRLQGEQPGRLNGLRVTRKIRPANQAQVLQTQGLVTPRPPLTVQAGQVFDIGLEVITDHPVNHVVITDPLPAGFEAVDTRFQTSTPYFQPQNDSWQIAYQTIHRDRVVAYGDRLEPGVYTLHYLVRAVTPGTFHWPGAQAHLQYAPEEFGRSASTQLSVTQ